MNSKLLHEQSGQKTFAVIFNEGDEVTDGLLEFAQRESISAAEFTGIGAFEQVTLGYFDWTKKDYSEIPIKDQVEVLAMIGDISLDVDDAPKVHAHVVLGRSDGTTRGGHLIAGTVRPTLEIVITESPTHLRRRHDPESGLSLIDISVDQRSY